MGIRRIVFVIEMTLDALLPGIVPRRPISRQPLTSWRHSGSNNVNYVIDLAGYPDVTMRTEATALLSRMLLAAATPDAANRESVDAFWKSYLEQIRNPNSKSKLKEHWVSFLGENKTYNVLVALDSVACQLGPKNNEYNIASTLDTYSRKNVAGDEITISSRNLAQDRTNHIGSPCQSGRRLDPK